MELKQTATWGSMMAVSEALRDRFGALTSSPLPGLHESTETAQTPGERAGSFLLDADRDSMSVMVMPSDPLTGLPYPIWPTGLTPRTHRDCRINYHHHFYYKNDKDLLGGRTYSLLNPENIPLDEISGLAVRMSRGQLLPVGDHEELHRRFRAGPEPPRNRAAKFHTVVLACAGVVPHFGLDLSRPIGEEIIELSKAQTAYFLGPRVLLAEKQYVDGAAYIRRATIGSFMLRYAAAQDLQHVSHRVVKEFLSTTDLARRIELGGLIMRDAISQSVEPIMPAYNTLRGEGMVPPVGPDLRASVRKLIKARPVTCMLSELSARLAVAYPAVA